MIKSFGIHSLLEMSLRRLCYTQPAKAEPAKAEPAKAEPAEAEPAEALAHGACKG